MSMTPPASLPGDDGAALPAVIIVAPVSHDPEEPDIHTWFSEQFENVWDTQRPVENVDDLWAGLADGTLSDTSKIVIFLDQLFDKTQPRNLFTEAVATFASEAAVLVATYGDNETQAAVQQGVAEWYRSLTNLVPGTFRMLDVTDETFGADPTGYVNALVSALYVENPGILTAATSASAEAVVAQPNYADQIAVGPSGVPIQPIAEMQAAPTPAAAQRPTSRRGIILASTSSKGGSGKTTVAMCTAGMLYHASQNAVTRGLAKEALKICVVDMDTRDGQIGFILGKTVPSALNVFLSDDKSVEQIMKQLVYSENLGVYALLAPKRARTAELLTPDFYRDVLEKLATEFDIVICDTSVFYLDTLLGEVVLPMADAVMFVTDISLGSVYGMTRWLDEVTTPLENGGNTGIKKDKVGVVVNKSIRNAGVNRDLLQKAARGAKILTSIPLDSERVIAASNFNNLSDIILKHPRISPAYFDLAQKIWRRTPLVSPMDMLEQQSGGKREVAPRPQVEGEAVAQTAKKRGGLFGFRK